MRIDILQPVPSEVDHRGYEIVELARLSPVFQRFIAAAISQEVGIFHRPQFTYLSALRPRLDKFERAVAEYKGQLCHQPFMSEDRTYKLELSCMYHKSEPFLSLQHRVRSDTKINDEQTSFEAAISYNQSSDVLLTPNNATISFITTNRYGQYIHLAIRHYGNLGFSIQYYPNPMDINGITIFDGNKWNRAILDRLSKVRGLDVLGWAQIDQRTIAQLISKIARDGFASKNIEEFWQAASKI